MAARNEPEKPAARSRYSEDRRLYRFQRVGKDLPTGSRKRTAREFSSSPSGSDDLGALYHRSRLCRCEEKKRRSSQCETGQGNSRMKMLAALLVGVLLLHLQCGGSCLSSSFERKVDEPSTSSEPPCHKHTEVPSKSQAPSRDGHSPCNQGPVADSKLSSGGKVTLQVPAMLPATVGLLATFDFGITGFIPEKTPHLPSSTVRLSVLRI